MSSIHLTFTGPYAGMTLCGDVRGETNYHAVHVNFKAPYAEHICPKCKAAWDEETTNEEA